MGTCLHVSVTFHALLALPPETMHQLRIGESRQWLWLVAEGASFHGSATFHAILALPSNALLCLGIGESWPEFVFFALIFLAYLIKEHSSSILSSQKYYLKSFFNTDTSKESFKVASQNELFQVILVSKVKEYWDKKLCNSGWNFPGVLQGYKGVV